MENSLIGFKKIAMTETSGKINLCWNISSLLPGLIKSDRPKSVAFKGESNAFDLKRKFCKQGRNVMLQQRRKMTRDVTWGNEMGSGLILQKLKCPFLVVRGQTPTF